MIKQILFLILFTTVCPLGYANETHYMKSDFFARVSFYFLWKYAFP